MRVSWTTVITTDMVAKHEQDDRFLQVAEHQIDRAAAEQQRQHRLAQDFEDDAQRRALVRAGKLVVPLGL